MEKQITFNADVPEKEISAFTDQLKSMNKFVSWEGKTVTIKFDNKKDWQTFLKIFFRK